MLKSLTSYRIFLIAILCSVAIVTLKFLFHYFNFEPIEQSSLHSSVSSGVFFVVGFILSATIADYKESERIPSDFSAAIDDMYEDAKAIHPSYPVFDLEGFRQQLHAVALSFGKDVREKSHDARKEVRALAAYFSSMESGKVPPNFIVKLKTQQFSLLRSLYRASYIQRISFIPSATILVRSTVALLIALLLLTNVDPFYGGLALVGLISFILIYMLILIDTISTPFHAEGKTRDDVSLFLMSEVAQHLADSGLALPAEQKKPLPPTGV
ncbi:MAG: hypothetical protein RLZZ296_612 [Pseudomonadota bacterium]|jgi:hypothetical protein